ncbi:MAG: hypothetical protein M5U34_30245 [Chloroflexi bacterium]|nr:hypothetical protein [Chloroflexota bacterium]
MHEGEGDAAKACFSRALANIEKGGNLDFSHYLCWLWEKWNQMVRRQLELLTQCLLAAEGRASAMIRAKCYQEAGQILSESDSSWHREFANRYL